MKIAVRHEYPEYFSGRVDETEVARVSDERKHLEEI
jgi:hypothetical protein